MDILVSRLLTAGALPAMSAISADAVLSHVPNEHSEKSCNKSHIVSTHSLVDMLCEI